MPAWRSNGVLLCTLLLAIIPPARAAIRLPVLFDSGSQPLAADGSWRAVVPAVSGQLALLSIESGDLDVTARLAAVGALPPRLADAPGKRWGREFFCVQAGPAGARSTITVQSVDVRALTGRVRAELVGLKALGALAMPFCETLAAATGQAQPETATAERLVAALRPLAKQVATLGATQLAGDAWLAANRLDYSVTSNWARASDSAQHAADAFQSAGAERDRADALFAFGDAQIELSQERPAGADAATLRRARVAAARVALRDARRLFQSQRRPRAAARAINDLGVSQLYEAEFADAERSFELARDESLALRDRTVQQLANANLATTLSRHGEPQRALRAFAELLGSIDDTTPVDLRLSWLQNSANPCFDTGDFDEALQRYLRALDLSRSSADEAAEARALLGIGRTYLELGDHARAISFLERSLDIRQRIGDTGGVRATLVVLGDARRADRAQQAARDLHTRALAVPASPAEEARTRLALALDLVAIGDAAAAMAQLDALDLLSIDDRHPYRVTARLQRSAVLRLLGRHDEALRAAQSAAADFGARRLVPAQIAARIEMQKALRAAGRYDAAIQAAGETATLFEHSWLAADSSSIRQRYRASRDGIYQEWVAAALAKAQQLEQAGNSSAALDLRRTALAAADSGRAREFQFTQRASGAVQSRAAVPADSNRLYDQLAGRFAALERAAERSSRATPTTRALETDIAELQARADIVSRDTALHPDRMRRVDSGRITALQQRLHPGALLAYYQTGEERSWLWLLTHERLEVRALDSRQALQSRMSAALTLLQSRSDNGEAARRLDAIAAAAGIVASDLTDIDRVEVVGDAGLSAWPWTYLWNLNRPANLAALAVKVAPALERATQPAAPSSPDTLLFGDPIYSRADERIAPAQSARPRKAVAAVDDLARLPGTARELQVVSAAMNGLPVRVFSGAAATRGRFLALAAGAGGVVHLATHGFDNPREPALSRLVFSRYDASGAVLASEVSARELMDLRWHPWLVVLSACESASGATLAGEGVMSTARAVLASGAKHVVGALWAVSDARSASLMQAFYQSLRSNRFDAAAALAEAQRKLLASEGERALPDAIAFAAFGPG